MNTQEQHSFYTGMVILGLLVRGAPVASISETTQHLVAEIMKSQTDKESHV